MKEAEPRADKREPDGNRGADGRFIKGNRANPFLPGVSGNPAGQISLKAHILKLLAEQVDTSKGKRTQAELFAQALIANGIKGNGVAIKQILDRIDGPVKEEVEASGTQRIIVEYGKYDDGYTADASEAAPEPEQG
jgi:hypothetical protein